MGKRYWLRANRGFRDHNRSTHGFPVLTESSPQQPKTQKGAIRVELERRLAAAAEAGHVRVLIVRAGDYFGPHVRNSWFAQGMVKPGKRVKAVLNGRADGAFYLNWH